jgi:hypothetical protein
MLHATGQLNQLIKTVCCVILPLETPPLPSQTNKVRRDASRHFRNKKKAYLKAKFEELETNSEINNIRNLYRGINGFKKGYQPITITVKDEKGDLVADSHSIMSRWRNYRIFQSITHALSIQKSTLNGKNRWCALYIRCALCN